MRATSFLFSALALYFSPVAVRSARIAHSITGQDINDSHDPPSAEERADDKYQCDRQCRWQHDFFDRSIVGKPRAKVGFFHSAGRYCACFKGGNQLGNGAIIPRHGEKAFDTVNTWSGDDDSGFDTNLVCAEAHDGSQETMDPDAATLAKRTILHCGACAACSSRHDIDVIAETRDWITHVMTAVSTKYAAPWGHGDAKRLAADLEGVGIDFSRTRADGKLNLPTCMDCWTDNIMCDASTCKAWCVTKFLNSSNPKTSISGDPGFFDMNAHCLKCDEENCGAEFIKCAGANRRSSGIISDIERPGRQQCAVGIYHGKPAKALPNALVPTKAQINEVDDQNKVLCATGDC